MMDSLDQVRELTNAYLGCYASVPHAGRWVQTVADRTVSHTLVS
jgi:hypothetical protein